MFRNPRSSWLRWPMPWLLHATPSWKPWRTHMTWQHCRALDMSTGTGFESISGFALQKCCRNWTAIMCNLRQSASRLNKTAVSSLRFCCILSCFPDLFEVLCAHWRRGERPPGRVRGLCGTSTWQVGALDALGTCVMCVLCFPKTPRLPWNALDISLYIYIYIDIGYRMNSGIWTILIFVADPFEKRLAAIIWCGLRCFAFYSCSLLSLDGTFFGPVAAQAKNGHPGTLCGRWLLPYAVALLAGNPHFGGH